jgi:hypothetical protein
LLGKTWLTLKPLPFQPFDDGVVFSAQRGFLQGLE